MRVPTTAPRPYKPTYNIIWSNTQTIKPAMFSQAAAGGC